MIQFIHHRNNSNTTSVKLEGKKVGEIRKVIGGYQYFPKGQKTGGEIFEKHEDVKTSLLD